MRINILLGGLKGLVKRLLNFVEEPNNLQQYTDN
jgi:hypothetical protein